MFIVEKPQTIAKIIAVDKKTPNLLYGECNLKKNCPSAGYQYFNCFKGIKKSPGYFNRNKAKSNGARRNIGVRTKCHCG